jgi:hypothetical protein
MNSMEFSQSSSSAVRISRWLIPLAAVIIFGLWFFIAPPGLLGKADAVGYAICHRIDERSFKYSGVSFHCVHDVPVNSMRQELHYCSYLW